MPLLLWLVILIQDGSPISPPVTSSLSPQDFECVYDYTQRTEEHAYMIKCASNTICIPSSYVCNGNEDCEDGSDEVNCNEDPETRQLQLNKILCSREEYRCQDVTGSCIPLDQTCDGVHHCRVHDDEDQQNCNDCKIKKCGYKCRITEYGGECYCPDGSNLNNDDRTCSSIDYCQTDPAKRCQQYCKNEENGYRCYCAEKYLLDDDDHTCHVEGGDDIQFVIAAGKREIITIPLVNKSNDVYTMEHKYMRENLNYPDDDQGYTRVLAYNNHDDAIYLVSREYRTHADLTAIVNNTEKVFRRDLYGPASITVDYVGGNIFYTQTYHSKPGIYICAADGIFCRRIVAGKEVIPWTDYRHFHTQIIKNRTHQLPNLFLWAMGAKRQFYAGIALNPFTGKMVYIDIYGNTKLMMANMDGTDIDELYDNGDAFIHGLAIDPFKDEVYFGNWYGYTIMRMNLKTKQRHTVVSKGAGWVYELNYFNGYLYWTCLTGKLKSARISTPNVEGKTLRQFKEFVSGLGIKHPHYQPMHPVNPCAEVAKTCPWMCVIIPGETPGTVKGKCLCPDNYKEEEGSCIPDRTITKTKHVHLLEAHSYVDVDYWKELCSKGIACLNGGQCAKIDENLNGATGETSCDCPVPFVGERCEVADPYASGSGWTIFWILLFIAMLGVTIFGIYYHKYGGKVNEFPREPIVRLLRRNNHSEVQLILDEANSRPELQLSQGLTIDTFKDEAYFGNWYGFTIMRMNLKTKQRHTVVSKGAGWVYELNYFNGYLYWTCGSRTLKSARIRSPNPEVKILRYFNESLNGMAIKHPSYQHRLCSGCAEVAKTCPWMCVIVPGGRPGTVKGKCLCPGNYKEEEGTCVPDKNFIKIKHGHLLETDSQVDVDYWRELCSKERACFNGGQCAKIQANQTIGETYCSCPSTFIGERCEIADPHSRGAGWMIFWILLFIIILMVTVSAGLYQWEERARNLMRTLLSRLTRRKDLPDVRYILDEPSSGNETLSSQPSISFSSPFFHTS